MTSTVLTLLDDPRATLEERVAAVRALGAGDPRAGVSAAIPAAAAWVGSDTGAPGNRPLRRIASGAYEIDLLPITVGRFAAFVEAGGYRDRGLWSEAGWEFLERGAGPPGSGETGRIVQPRFWGEEQWRAYLHPSHPVVGASVFEAEAFARWCGRRLPTGDEWERAARGEDGRAYPWGEIWDPARAHHRGSDWGNHRGNHKGNLRGNLRGTLPAGCFPGGRSPHGLWDCAGNVWEWTADAASEDAAGLRTARGGGWNGHPAQLRCAALNRWPPEARFSHLGFRTAR